MQVRSINSVNNTPYRKQNNNRQNVNFGTFILEVDKTVVERIARHKSGFLPRQVLNKRVKTKWSRLLELAKLFNNHPSSKNIDIEVFATKPIQASGNKPGSPSRLGATITNGDSIICIMDRKPQGNGDEFCNEIRSAISELWEELKVKEKPPEVLIAEENGITAA